MPLHNFEADGKPHSGSYILPAIMQALKRLENAFGKLWFESDPIVFYEYFAIFLPVARRIDFNPGGGRCR
jgi:hypothetical protein